MYILTVSLNNLQKKGAKDMRELFPLTGLITPGRRRPKTSRESQLLYGNSSFGRLSEYGRCARGIEFRQLRDRLAWVKFLENWILAESSPYLNQQAPNLRRLETDEEDLKNKGVRNWRRKSQDRELWRTILEEAKVHREL